MVYSLAQILIFLLCDVSISMGSICFKNMVWWALVRGRIQKTSSSEASFFLLTRQMMERLSGKEFEIWAMTAWAIWTARNRIPFQHTQPHPREILKQANDLMGEYQKLVKDLVQRQKAWCFLSSFAKTIGETQCVLFSLYFLSFFLFFWLVFVEAVGHAACFAWPFVLQFLGQVSFWYRFSLFFINIFLSLMSTNKKKKRFGIYQNKSMLLQKLEW